MPPVKAKEQFCPKRSMGRNTLWSFSAGSQGPPRKLRATKKNISIVEPECLAIKWTLDSLRYFLFIRGFCLVSDHAPLTWKRQIK